MKFSIIIPVYNVEEYLEECLQSILAQNYSDYEVLLVNDGSVDSSGVICDRYSEKDSRFRVFQQQNKGVSAARNLGLDHATGEWICFIDSDDLIEANYLGAFSDNISGDSDLVMQGIQRIGKVNDILCSFTNLEKLTKEEFFDHYRIWPHYFSPCNKIYRRKIVIDQNLRFDESISYAEDTLFNLDYAINTKGMFTILPNINYTYRFNHEGLATKNIGFFERRELLQNVKEKLQKLTNKRDDLYPYSVVLLKMLYLDKSVKSTYKHLKLFVKEYKTEVIKIYEGERLSLKIITFLIKMDCYFIVDLIFKILYWREFKFEISFSNIRN